VLACFLKDFVTIFVYFKWPAFMKVIKLFKIRSCCGHFVLFGLICERKQKSPQLRGLR
jgi:hypothetical protein